MDHPTARPDLTPSPARGDRATATELLDTLELWPLDWWAVNGAAVCEAAELLRVAWAKLTAPSPPPRWAESSPASSAADREAVHSTTE
jgi:hypothetical protein